MIGISRKSLAKGLALLLLAAALLCVLNSCGSAKVPSYPELLSEPEKCLSSADELLKAGRLRWLKTAGDSAKGTAILVHGLNNKPQIMDALVPLLHQESFDVLRLTLTAHDGLNESKHAASAGAWLRDISTAYCLARRENRGSRLVNISYSAGALVSSTFLLESSGSFFDRMIFFAPAIKLKPHSCLISLLGGLRLFNLSLPSLAAKKHRVYDSTSLDSYHAYFQLLKRFRRSGHYSRLNCPTVVFISPADELLSFAEIKGWIRESELSNWKLIEIEAQTDDAAEFHHLIVDPDNIGRKQWERIEEKVADFIRS